MLENLKPVEILGIVLAALENLKPVEFLGIVAAVLELGQLYFLGKRKKIGFILGACGGSCWITYSIISQSAWGLLFVCSCGIFLNTRGFLNWTKKEKYGKN